jgi:hypothetical protein
MRDIHAGRAAVDGLIREGLFLRESQVVFEHVAHASDVETWLAYREARAARSLLDPQIIQRARDLLPPAEGEIRIANRGYAALLRKRADRREGTDNVNGATQPTEQ